MITSIFLLSPRASRSGSRSLVLSLLVDRLKDSDVTWLYGPLHTSVDPVPPPKEATTSDRLGLEPLRSLSDSKRTAAGATTTSDTTAPSSTPSTADATQKAPTKKTRRPDPVTKPILKYRSLSDMLLPAGATSPVLEDPDLNLDDQSTISIHHARSDSSLVRLNSLNRHTHRRKKRGSPLTSPRSSSPERGASDSSSASVPQRKEHRHISFNHRVEQCIAVDSQDEARRRPTSSLAVGTSRSSSDEEDEDDEVLTFKSSNARLTAGGHPGQSHSKAWEPHTIARLGPTTLKNIEAYPAPSPIVVYPSDPAIASATSGPPGGYNQTKHLYGQQAQQTAQQSATSSQTGAQQPQQQPSSLQQQENGQAGRPAQNPPPTIAGRRAMYDYSNSVPVRQNWDPEDEDDYAMGFDYYSGPDVGVGDEYDMAQYGSTHLVGGTHNDFGAPHYMNAHYGHSQAHQQQNNVGQGQSYGHMMPNHPSSSSNTMPVNSASQQPSSSTLAYNGSVPPTTIVSAAARGPHAPPASARDAPSAKRSILKSGGGSGGGRSRESSVESSISNVSSLGSSPRSVNSPINPNSSTSSSSASPSTSPYGSSSTLGGLATAIPQHVRPNLGSRRSSDDTREEGSRGRSTSRGSSASLDRSASADRRNSTSISPSSYSPPSPSLTGSAATKPIGIAQSRRVGSYESLNGHLAGHIAGTGSGGSVGTPRSLSDVTEASSESEADTVRNGVATVSNVLGTSPPDGQIEDVRFPVPATFSDGENNSGTSTPQALPVDEHESTALPPAAATASLISATAVKSRPAPVTVDSTQRVAAGPVSPPLVPAPPMNTARSTTGPRFRQPSPSHTTTSTTDEEGHATAPVSTTAANATAESSPKLSSSLSDSPALGPTDLASTPWSDEAVPSYARRSLLRAARGNSATSSSSSAAGSTGSHSLSKTLSRDSAATTTGTSSTIGDDVRGGGGTDNRRHSHPSHRDYDLDYWQSGDDAAGSGLVGRTLEVAGTAKDLLGAISKSLWGGLRR